MSLLDGVRELRAAMLSTKGGVAAANGDFYTSEQLCRKSLALMERALGDCPLTALHVGNLATALKMQDRVEESVRASERAIAMLEAAPPSPSDDELVADQLRARLNDHLEQLSFDDAEPILRRVVAAIERRTDPAVVAGVLREIAQNLYMPVFRDRNAVDGDKKLAEAEVLFRRALHCYGMTSEPDVISEAPSEPEYTSFVVLSTPYSVTPDLSTSTLFRFWVLDGLGYTLSLRGRFSEAETVHREALRLLEENVEVGDAIYQRAYVSLADMFLMRRDFAQAEGFLKQALSVGEQHLGPVHPENLQGYELLADTLQQLDRGDEAAVFEERAAEIRKQIQE